MLHENTKFIGYVVCINMMTVQINTDQITDDVSFHTVFEKLMGFPSFYGQNMDAWIDCMSCVNDPTSGMTKITIGKGGILFFKLVNFESFQTRCPEVTKNFFDCISIVNKRLWNDEAAIAILL